MPLLVLSTNDSILNVIKILGRGRDDPGEVQIFQRRFRNHLVLANPFTPNITTPNATFEAGPLNKQTDCHTLFNIKYVFILRAIRGMLSLFSVTMKVENVDLLETSHQRLAHTAERWIVKPRVIGDYAD